MKASTCILSVKRSLSSAGVSGGLLVGVSGGPDSVALLHMLHSLGEYELYAAHLHHGIRGTKADEDAAFVRDLCGKLGVPYYEGKANVPEMSELYKISLEEAARNARYEFLRRVKKRCVAEYIVTGHQSDDQAETVLIHLLRGSGTNGICGMREKSNDVLRPMLSLSRNQIMDYLEQNEIEYRTDDTNNETCCTRNRVRLELIPKLSEYNPNIKKSLCSLSSLAAEDEDYLDEMARESLNQTRIGANTYKRESLSALPGPVKSRAVKNMLIEAGLAYDRAAIESVTRLLDANSGASCSLFGGFIARASYKKLIIERADSDLDWLGTALIIPGETKTPGGVLCCDFVQRIRKDESPYVAYMDADKLDGAVVRKRQNGDRFHPLGAPGSKKLKDYLIDKKIPRELRSVALIANESEILFFPGGAVSNSVRVDGSTKRILRVEYIKS